MRTLLLFILLCLAACSPAVKPPLIPGNPYDAELRNYTYRYKDKRQLNEKQVRKYETALQRAQAIDLRAVDSLMLMDTPDKWVHINAYHRRIRARQNSVKPIVNKPTARPVSMQWTAVTDIQEKENASRQAAAAHLYQKAQDLLADAANTGKKAPARKAWETLDNLTRQYYSEWENTQTLLDSANSAGQTRMALDIIPGYDTESESFWHALSHYHRLTNSQWGKVSLHAPADTALDFRVSCRLSNITIGGETQWTTTREETEKVQTGCTEVKDSTGRVISREPIYETRTKTIPQWHVSRDASATVLVEVYDGLSGQRLFAQTLSEQYNYADQSEIVQPSAPTMWRMAEILGERVAEQLRHLLHEDLVNR